MRVLVDWESLPPKTQAIAINSDGSVSAIATDNLSALYISVDGGRNRFSIAGTAFEVHRNVGRQSVKIWREENENAMMFIVRPLVTGPAPSLDSRAPDPLA